VGKIDREAVFAEPFGQESSRLPFVFDQQNSHRQKYTDSREPTQ
jgi:hypothetical protein